MGVGLSKKEEVVFLRGRGVDTPMHTMIYLLKANNRNNRKRCEICSKFTVKKKQQKNVIDVALVFLLLTLNIFHTFY